MRSRRCRRRFASSRQVGRTARRRRAEGRPETDRRVLAREPRRGRQGVGTPGRDAGVHAHARMDRQRDQGRRTEGREGRDLRGSGLDVGAEVVAECSWSATPASAPARRRSRCSRRFRSPAARRFLAAALTAPVVYVGHGTDADLAGRDVKGRIAVAARASRAVAVRRGRAGRGAEDREARRGRRDQRDRRSGQRAIHRSAIRVRRRSVLHDRRAGRVVPAGSDRQGRERRHRSTG